MAFTDAFTGFFKKDPETAKIGKLVATTVDANPELRKGAAYNVLQTDEHQARAQGIDAKEKGRFEALFGADNLAMEQRNLKISNQFADQGFSSAMDQGLQSAMRQFTGAAAQSTAGTGLWGRGAGLPISTAANRTADMIGRGQQYGVGLNQQLLGNQQNRAFSYQNAANNLWNNNMVRPETFLQQANWNTERQDATANQNMMLDWQNSQIDRQNSMRKSLFEQGIQRSMSSTLDLATNPQTQLGVVTSMCGSGAAPQTYPGANGAGGGSMSSGMQQVGSSYASPGGAGFAGSAGSSGFAGSAGANAVNPQGFAF